MDKDIKQYADSGDITSLKYIFVDSLDVDPTFELYEDSYNYCKAVPGLLEHHKELTPFTYDQSKWTEDYWVKLKVDLKKNFSDKRMTHMREVAKVYLADKIERLEKERWAARAAATPLPVQPRPQVTPSTTVVHQQSRVTMPSEEEQNRALEKDRKLLEAEKKHFDEERAADEARRAALRAASNQQRLTNGDPSKKAFGVVIAIAAAVIVILGIIFLLINHNP